MGKRNPKRTVESYFARRDFVKEKYEKQEKCLTVTRYEASEHQGIESRMRHFAVCDALLLIEHKKKVLNTFGSQIYL